MEFFTLIWNTIMRTLGFMCMLIVEGIVFFIIHSALVDSGYYVLSTILTVIFVVFIIVQVFSKLTRAIIKPFITYIKSFSK